MTSKTQHLLNLYQAISDGAQGDELANFFHPEAEQIEYPSAVRPNGHRRGLAEMRAGAAVGVQFIADQRYDVHTVIEEGDQVAVQFTWTARAAQNLGAIQAGTQMVAHVAAFYVFRDGLVLRQSSYDCYEPFVAPATTSPAPALAGTSAT